MKHNETKSPRLECYIASQFAPSPLVEFNTLLVDKDKNNHNDLFLANTETRVDQNGNKALWVATENGDKPISELVDGDLAASGLNVVLAWVDKCKELGLRRTIYAMRD